MPSSHITYNAWEYSVHLDRALFWEVNVIRERPLAPGTVMGLQLFKANSLFTRGTTVSCGLTLVFICVHLCYTRGIQLEDKADIHNRLDFWQSLCPPLINQRFANKTTSFYKNASERSVATICWCLISVTQKEISFLLLMSELFRLKAWY